MVQMLNEQPNVTFSEVKADVFYDYGDLLDRFYNSFPGGSVQGNHVFRVESSKPTTVFTKETSLEPTITLNFRNDKFVRKEDRLMELKNYVLKPVTAPGMKPTKQVELYTKWHKFVPAEFQDEICPRPTQEVLANVQESRKKKNRERNAQKRSRTARGSAGRGGREEEEEAGDQARRRAVSPS
jgi:hypothetical protein